MDPAAARSSLAPSRLVSASSCSASRRRSSTGTKTMPPSWSAAPALGCLSPPQPAPPPPTTPHHPAPPPRRCRAATHPSYGPQAHTVHRPARNAGRGESWGRAFEFTGGDTLLPRTRKTPAQSIKDLKTSHSSAGEAGGGGGRGEAGGRGGRRGGAGRAGRKKNEGGRGEGAGAETRGGRKGESFKVSE